MLMASVLFFKIQLALVSECDEQVDEFRIGKILADVFVIVTALIAEQGCDVAQ